jgi:hypothetical protein
MPTAQLRLSNVCEVGLSANSIPQLPQSATASVAWRQPCLSSVLPCTPSTKYSIAWYRYSLLSAYGIQLNPTCRESIILSL